MRQAAFPIFAFLLAAACAPVIAAEPPPDFEREIAPILAKYCSGCHNETDREGDLSLETFASLQKGGEKGAVIIPGKADASLMIRAIQGDVEPKMPPEDNPRPTPQ